MRTIALLLLASCAVAPGSNSLDQDTSATQYVNIFDFPKTDQGAWYDLMQKLNGELVASKQFPGVTPLSFYCSVTSKAGDVHDCTWTFASSQVAVDGTTAAIDVDAPTYQCHVHPKMTSVKLIALLTDADDALHAPLPGTTSLADALPDCFAHPIDATTLAPGAGTTYVEASSYYTTAANQQKWTAAKAALVNAFDNICGDTFCSSDFNDLQSLTFACAVTKSTGNVKSCAWTFGGSFPNVAANGALAPTSQTFTCTVPVHGTIAQLITTLTNTTDSEDAIHRALPGGTASAYDALTCLP